LVKIYPASGGYWAMNFTNSTDKSLIAFYESIRRQVEADKSSGGRYRFIGETAKQYAERLR